MLILYLFIKIFRNKFLNAKYTFLEFPLDKSILSALMQKFSCGKLIFFPHSPHIYAEDRIFLNDSKIHGQMKLIGNVNYIFGFKADYEFFKSQGWAPIEGATMNFIGHGVYSKKWSFCSDYVVKSQNKNLLAKQKLNVVILSRGYGSFLDFDEQKYLCSSTFEVLKKYIDVACVKVKLHPRETQNTYWKYLDKRYFEIVQENVSTLISEADLVIGFWSSAAMDSYFFGNGCYIEFYRPDLNHEGQVKTNNGYKTIYNLLGAVHSAECQESLETLVQKFFDRKLSKKQGSNSMEHIRSISDDWESEVKVLLNL